MKMSNAKDMKGEHTVTFQVPAGTVFDLQHKKKVLTAFASLPMEDIERLEQLITSPKALAALKKHWLMLKTMFK